MDFPSWYISFELVGVCGIGRCKVSFTVRNTAPCADFGLAGSAGGFGKDVMEDFCDIRSGIESSSSSVMITVSSSER